MPKFLGISKGKGPQSAQDIPKPEQQDAPIEKTLGGLSQQQDFAQFDTQTEGYGGWALRNMAGIGQSVAGTLGGLPGSIATGAAKILGPAAMKAHEALISPPEGVTQEEFTRGTSKPVVDPEKIWDPITGLGLTVGGVKKHISKAGEKAGISPEYWEPQTEGEKTVRDYAERVTALMHPLLMPISAGKALLAPIVGAGGRKAAKALGLGDLGQEIAGGIGEAVFIGWDPKKIQEKMGALFDKGRDLLRNPKSGIFAVNSMKLLKMPQIAKKFIKNIKDPTKAEKWMIDRARGIQDAIKDQKIEVEKIWDLKSGFGKHVLEYKGDPKDISGFSNKVFDTFDNMIEGYGKKYNPEFLKVYKDANSIFKGFKDMPKFVKTLNDVIEKRGDLISLLLATGSLTFGTAGKALVGMKLFKNAAEGVTAIKNSPAIMKHFGKGILAATKQNAKSAALYFEKADKEMEKKFPGILDALKKEKGAQKKEGIKFLGVKN